MMAPNQNFVLNTVSMEPVSRTYQYRKVMKPMLERKRRARINRCLDELKDLMTGALQAEGENVAKLEKADILELTVRHLHSLREQNSLFFRPDQGYQDRFWDGFRLCAKEVTQFLVKCDQSTGVRVMKHINRYIDNLEPTQQLLNVAAIKSDPSAVISSYDYRKLSDRTLTRSPLKQGYNGDDSSVWRPW